MAHYNFCLYNHDEIGASTLDDLVEAVGHQLHDLGHTVCRTDFGLHHPPTINIIFEGFCSLLTVHELKRAKDAMGARIWLMNTERPSTNGFNNWSGNHPMAIRWRMLPEALKWIDGVSCLVPGAASVIKKLHPNTVDMELGYSPSRVDKIDVEPEWDYVFFGLFSERRKEIIRKLEKGGLSVKYNAEAWNNPFKSFVDRNVRDDWTRRSRGVLHIKQQANWQIVSNSRCCTAIHLRRGVMSDPHNAPESAYQKIIRSSRTHGSFVDDCITFRDNWREEATRQMDAMKTILPPEACVGAAIKKLGML